MRSIKRSGTMVLKNWGSWNFYGADKLSKQAGCFGTYWILNATVLDNLIYIKKRKRKRLKKLLLTGMPWACQPSPAPHAQTKQLHRVTSQAWLTAGINTITPRRRSIKTRSFWWGLPDLGQVSMVSLWSEDATNVETQSRMHCQTFGPYRRAPAPTAVLITTGQMLDEA